MNEKDSPAIEYFKKLAEVQGVAVSTVADGTVILITEQKLQDLLKASTGKGYVMLFIQKEVSPENVN